MSEELQNQNGLQRNGDVAPFATGPALEVTTKAGNDIAAETGLLIIPTKAIESISAVGIQADAKALIGMASGAVILTIPALLEMVNEILAVSRKTKSEQRKISCALAIAALGKVLLSAAPAVKADGLAAQSSKPQRNGQKRVFAAQMVSPPPPPAPAKAA